MPFERPWRRLWEQFTTNNGSGTGASAPEEIALSDLNQRYREYNREYFGITKSGDPERFNQLCGLIGIDPEKFEDQTSLLEAIDRSFPVPGDAARSEAVMDLWNRSGLPICPTTARKAVEKGIEGYRFDTLYGDSEFVPLGKGQEDA